MSKEERKNELMHEAYDTLVRAQKMPFRHGHEALDLSLVEDDFSRNYGDTMNFEYLRDQLAVIGEKMRKECKIKKEKFNIFVEVDDAEEDNGLRTREGYIVGPFAAQQVMTEIIEMDEKTKTWVSKDSKPKRGFFELTHVPSGLSFSSDFEVRGKDAAIGFAALLSHVFHGVIVGTSKMTSLSRAKGRVLSQAFKEKRVPSLQPWQFESADDWRDYLLAEAVVNPYHHSRREMLLLSSDFGLFDCPVPPNLPTSVAKKTPEWKRITRLFNRTLAERGAVIEPHKDGGFGGSAKTLGGIEIAVPWGEDFKITLEALREFAAGLVSDQKWRSLAGKTRTKSKAQA